RNSVMVTGTPPSRSSKKNLTSTGSRSCLTHAPVEKHQLLEQVDILLVLQQRAVQHWQGALGILREQHLGIDILSDQQLDPVEQLGGRRLFPQAGGLAQLEERAQGLGQQVFLQPRVVNLDDPLHRRFVGKADVVEEATAQEGIRQLLLVVARDHDD